MDDELDLEAGRLLFARPFRFVKGCVRIADLPPTDRVEIAFAGRSNVGKSSLINVLVNRKGLVRTSSTPGRTQLINFFRVNGNLMLVDLPGYGFAKVPLAVKREWGPMVETYLSTRPNLGCVVLIVDVRRVPTEEDQLMLQWLRAYNIPALVVVTKCDKVSKNERARQVAVITRTLGLSRDEMAFFSALSKEGRDEVWGRIEAILAAGQEEPEESGE